MYIYKCRAGLTETAMSLKDGLHIIGYVVFGQITDIKDKSELNEFTEKINEKYNLNCTASGIRYRNKKEIAAAASLFEICTKTIFC